MGLLGFFGAIGNMLCGRSFDGYDIHGKDRNGYNRYGIKQKGEGTAKCPIPTHHVTTSGQQARMCVRCKEFAFVNKKCRACGYSRK